MLPRHSLDHGEVQTLWASWYRKGRDEIPLARWESAELEEGLVERVRSELSTARYAS